MADETRELRVAIVGLGHLHPRGYVPLFAAMPGVKLEAAVERDAQLRDPFCADFKVNGYVNLHEMLAAEKPDIAAIFLPHDECPAAAEECAGAGVHIMVEKPMASTAAGAERIARAARENNVKLTTGYCWRMHPAAREFRRLIREGVLGRIIGADCRCAAGGPHRYVKGPSPWMVVKARSGGGPIFNLGVHWIDLLRWMLGEEVVEVSGRNVKVNADYDIEDNSFAHLRFSGGAIAALDINYTVPDSFPHGRDLYVAVRGTSGVISWAPAYEGEKDVLFVCSDHPSFAGSPRRQLTFDLEPVKGYSGFMGLEYVRNFVNAIRCGRNPEVTGEDGVAALRVVEAVYRSADEKRWVSV